MTSTRRLVEYRMGEAAVGVYQVSRRQDSCCPDTFFLVRADLAEERQLAFADVVVCTAGETSVAAERFAKEMMAQLPGCSVVVVRLPDDCIAVHTRGGGTRVFHGDGSEATTAAVAVQAYCSLFTG
jgi:hypothetical protein